MKSTLMWYHEWQSKSFKELNVVSVILFTQLHRSFLLFMYKNITMHWLWWHRVSHVNFHEKFQTLEKEKKTTLLVCISFPNQPPLPLFFSFFIVSRLTFKCWTSHALLLHWHVNVEPPRKAAISLDLFLYHCYCRRWLLKIP